MASAARRFLVSWESIQVELHGRYSGDRLLAFARYHHETSTLRALAVVLLTPVPCAIVVSLGDIVPLQSAYIGLKAQGAAYWVRTYYSSFIICFTMLVQFSQSTPGLPLTLKTACIAAVFMGLSFCVTFLGLHLWIGFPTPFLVSLQTVGSVATFATAFYVLWGKKIRASAVAQRDITRYMTGFWNSEIAMLTIYPAMTYVFRTLDSRYQTLFSMLMPGLKMAIKNTASYGLRHIEEYAPVCIAFSVDVFHTLFLSSAMQSARSTGTLAVIMTVDLFQSLVAGFEIRTTMDRLHRLARRIDRLEAAEQTTTEPDTELVQLKSSVQNVLSRSAFILASSDAIRNDERICPRGDSRTASSRDSLRLQSAQVLRDDTNVRLKSGPSAPTSCSRFCGMTRKVVQVQAKTRPVSRQVRPRPSTGAALPKVSTLSPIDEARLCFVQETMQLLFMMEFYLLIELVEVVVPTVYSIYLGILFHLSNRYNYAHLKKLTDQEYLDTLQYVITYAALEMASLIILAVALRRMVGISPLRHLAFTLQTNWKFAQPLLTVWVFFPIQLALDHFGYDYTMKFEWLHKPHNNSN